MRNIILVTALSIVIAFFSCNKKDRDVGNGCELGYGGDDCSTNLAIEYEGEYCGDLFDSIDGDSYECFSFSRVVDDVSMFEIDGNIQARFKNDGYSFDILESEVGNLKINGGSGVIDGGAVSFMFTYSVSGITANVSYVGISQ